MQKQNYQVGDVIFVTPGKDDTLIGHTSMGKVVIPTNDVKAGYIKLTEVVEKKTCILVKGENVPKDYFTDISYEEFLKVLPINGYKVGFDIPFQSPYEYGEEREIFAYNKELGIAIVAETFEEKNIFNTIKVYCPNMSCFEKIEGCRMDAWNIFSHGGNRCVVFDLCRSNYDEDLLSTIAYFMNDVKSRKGIVWPENQRPHLYNYSDIHNQHNLDTKPLEIERCRLLPEDAYSVFEGSSFMRENMKKPA